MTEVAAVSPVTWHHSPPSNAGSHGAEEFTLETTQSIKTAARGPNNGRTGKQGAEFQFTK